MAIKVHFVRCYPAFDDLRYKFIEPKHLNKPREFRLTLLFDKQNELSLRNLAVFLYKACHTKIKLAIVKNINVHHDSE